MINQICDKVYEFMTGRVMVIDALIIGALVILGGALIWCIAKGKPLAYVEKDGRKYEVSFRGVKEI